MILANPFLGFAYKAKVLSTEKSKRSVKRADQEGKPKE
jgi:hypothetical protein